MKILTYGSGYRYGDPNIRWGNPSYILEPGDPGYVPPGPLPTPKPHKRKRKYMASNPTPDRVDELIAAGEDLCDGLHTHAVAITVKTPRPTRARTWNR